MGARPPDGEPAPRDGRLPDLALAVRPFGIYVHVPFCSSRCGYCDFNTYTPAELGSSDSPNSYLKAALVEIKFARRVLGDVDRPVSTVFFGGGTPTLLPAADLDALLAAVRDEFGLTPDAEITTEANPDSVDQKSLTALRESGFTRLSFGLQSTSQRALAVLERTHTPGRAVEAIAMARAAGFDHVNADVIYAIPGESRAELADTLGAVVASGVDHVSAYSLIVEEGTRMAAAVRRGQVVPVDDDTQAESYLQVDAALTAATMSWYEVSNWSMPGSECLHNLGYWRGNDWWGIGPGAHSHVGGVRWWNVRHPAAYADRLEAGDSPAQARELLDAEDRRVENVLLRLRLAEGLPLDSLTPSGRDSAEWAASEGLLDREHHAAGRAVLTLRGRLLADAVVLDLVD